MSTPDPDADVGRWRRPEFHASLEQLLAPLTRQQRQVLWQFLQEPNDAVVARRLGLRKSTVRNHLRAIEKKLQVPSRTHLMKALLEAVLSARPPDDPTPHPPPAPQKQRNHPLRMIERLARRGILDARNGTSPQRCIFSFVARPSRNLVGQAFQPARQTGMSAPRDPRSPRVLHVGFYTNPKRERGNASPRKMRCFLADASGYGQTGP